MLTTLDIVVYLFVALVLLPVAVYSLATGSKPPRSSRITKSLMAFGILSIRTPFGCIEEDRIIKCYHIEPYLRLVSDLLLLTIGAAFASKLAIHFSLAEANLVEWFKNSLGVPFVVLFFTYVLILARGLQRLRSEEREQAERKGTPVP